MSRRHEVSDSQWERIERLLPPERGREGRPSLDNRLMVNGILWVLRTGAPWRDLPERFGRWNTVYSRFSRWSKRDVWGAVLKELMKDQDSETYFIDATIVRAHQDAFGAPLERGVKRSESRAVVQPRSFTLVSTPSETRFISTSHKAKSTT